jgi:hypothetical protein
MSASSLALGEAARLTGKTALLVDELGIPAFGTSLFSRLSAILDVPLENSCDYFGE